MEDAPRSPARASPDSPSLPPTRPAPGAGPFFVANWPRLSYIRHLTHQPSPPARERRNDVASLETLRDDVPGVLHLGGVVPAGGRLPVHAGVHGQRDVVGAERLRAGVADCSVLQQPV